METITYSEFNSKISFYIDEILKQKKNLIVTKDGEPYFKVSSIQSNKIKDSIIFEDDLVRPVNAKWEAD